MDGVAHKIQQSSEEYNNERSSPQATRLEVSRLFRVMVFPSTLPLDSLQITTLTESTVIRRIPQWTEWPTGHKIQQSSEEYNNERSSPQATRLEVSRLFRVMVFPSTLPLDSLQITTLTDSTFIRRIPQWTEWPTGHKIQQSSEEYHNGRSSPQATRLEVSRLFRGMVFPSTLPLDSLQITTLTCSTLMNVVR
ncbi:unnamed protein product [Danaus chrysippus]|uniref:(African queen) hypothetical protein n=1 Tax=Danaus chrysippus TaxID=151541 RepID=A0A8J2VRB1_9NEOP|nr:unnamed protein product [Danaus chrysippus]